MKYARLLFALLLALCVVAHSCNEEPTALDARTTLSLSVVDSTCIDIELKLATQNPNGQRLVVERQVANESPVVVFDAVLNKPDTSILDTGLMPNTPYAYRAYRLANNTKTDASEERLARTMDTTSHDWTWTLHTFGDFSSSAFYDVAIINDTLAYAVGKIYLRDSLGQNDPTPYNLAIWNGQSWRFEQRKFNFRLLYPNSGGDQFGIGGINAIYAFGPNDIWISAGTVQHWNGSTWTEHSAIVGYDSQGFPIAAGGALKIWGSSSSNLYFVGRDGLIIHYNGSLWRRIESGTSLSFYDVYGDGGEVLAVGSEYSPQRQENVLLRLGSANGQRFSTVPILYDIETVWFAPNRSYMLAGSGIYEKRRLSDSLWQEAISPQLNTYHTSRIRGQAINDVITAGSFREIWHYNGATWQNFRAQIPNESGPLGGIAMRGNLAFIVGFSNSRAVVVIGRRNQ